MNSITRLPVEEAYALAKSLSNYAGISFTSFSRFTNRDFDGYYKKRIRTEDWLYKSFIALGGKPKTKAPLYFVLGESNYLSHWFENGTRYYLSGRQAPLKGRPLVARFVGVVNPGR